MTDRLPIYIKYAIEKHAGDKRKYTGVPYIEHPARVAGQASMHFAAKGLVGKEFEDIVGAAWCHDVAEDCFDTPEEGFQDMTDRLFSEQMIQYCRELCNPSKNSNAPRAERKAQDREHLKVISQPAKILKLIDRKDNVQDMVHGPLDFAELYGKETRLLVDCLKDADSELAVQVLEALDKTLSSMITVHNFKESLSELEDQLKQGIG